MLAVVVVILVVVGWCYVTTYSYSLPIAPYLYLLNHTNTQAQAIVWGRRSLPSLRSKRRKSWVRRAVLAAEEQLQELLGTSGDNDDDDDDEEGYYDFQGGDAWQ